MSEKLKESLSAVIDSEADEFELRRVLDEMGRSEQLTASWERYHMIGSVLRGERSVVTSSMRERIWAEIQSDPEGGEVATAVAAETRSLSPVASTPEPAAAEKRWAPFAVAASVAAAVLVGFVGFSELNRETPAAVIAEAEPTVNSTLKPRYETVPAIALTNEVTDSDQNRMDAYMVRHYQQIGMDRPGLGFAKMVAYERN